MTIYNLGSINVDLFHRVPHLPGPGETLAATSHHRGLGGKGANMSVAAARAAARCAHIGAVGADGRWARDRLMEYGVDTRHIRESPDPTGHAIIATDARGENNIITFGGANHTLGENHISDALAEARPDDLFLFQNETNGAQRAATLASARGMRIVHAAAPFDATSVTGVLPLLDLLVMNEVEAQQLTKATGSQPLALPVRDVVVTLGAKGCLWHNTDRGETQAFDALKVTPVDTTGAGDTFTGFLVAGLDRGLPMAQAIALAQKAGALMVTRHGTADVIPDLKEIEDATFGP